MQVLEHLFILIFWQLCCIFVATGHWPSNISNI